jgi:hypothetical protein
MIKVRYWALTFHKVVCEEVYSSINNFRMGILQLFSFSLSYMLYFPEGPVAPIGNMGTGVSTHTQSDSTGKFGRLPIAIETLRNPQNGL